MGFRDDIKALYRAEPTLSGKEILARLGKPETPQNWRILNETQVGIRGLYPGKPKARPMGMSRFIPPKPEGSK